MVRTPCCEKMGLKKGPWTPEEDHILIDYIHRYGHGNWRALPKQAGLLRCGKSCRLRWTNYLRPDIKRGNFSREEEETIIKLHGALGNRWSAIASRLPGRTDNEIKNVWNTRLRKRVNQIPPTIPVTKPYNFAHHQTPSFEQFKGEEDSKPLIFARPNSPQNSSSEISSVTTANNFPAVDETFWSEVFSGVGSDFPVVNGDPQPQPPVSQLYGYDSNVYDGMDYWYDLFKRGGEIPELVEFKDL